MEQITLTYNTELNLTFMSWCESLDITIHRILNPTIDEKRKRLARIEESMIAPFKLYAKKLNISLREIGFNNHLRKRKNVWDQNLRLGCTEFSDTEITLFLESLGINFRDIQHYGIIKSIKSPITLLSAICGSGKTLMMLSVIQFLKTKKNSRAIYFAPNSVCEELPKELKKFRNYFDLSIDNLSGETDYEAGCRIEYGSADILIIPYSKAHKFVSAIEHAAALPDARELVLFLDEGHFVKNCSSRISKSIQRFAPFFERIIISSATPMPQSSLDIRGYLSLVTSPLPEKMYIDNEIPQRDYDLLKGMVFVTSEDDLPYGEINNLKFLYNDEAELNNFLVSEINSEILRNGKVVIFCSSNKAMSEVYHLLNGVGRTVLSGTYSTSSIGGELNYESSYELQQKAITDFNTDPDCKVLIANYKVGSTGLNLQGSGARMAFFYEITVNGADFFQSKYRIRRPYIFPKDGFKYIYAIPQDIRKRKRVTKQFEKLRLQTRLLSELR